MSDHIHIVLAKGNERYIVSCRADNASEGMRTLGRWASNPELDFTWGDAAMMSQQLRREVAEAAECMGR